MKKAVTLATFASVIALPAFAQSFDPEVGTGNIIPPVANVGAPSAYARAPAIYEREYVRHRRAYRSQTRLCRRWSTEKREPCAHRDQQILIGSVNNFIQRSCHSEHDLGLSHQLIAGRQLRQVH